MTFRQLKESNYYHPEVTEVIYDNNIMIDMAVGAMQISEIGFDAVWDSHLCNWASKYFLDGIRLVEKQVLEKGIKVKHLVDVTSENLEFIKTLNSFELKHLDGLNSNFGIFDKRTYMVFILHKKSDEPLQTFFSNSKSLVQRQQQLFNDLWNMAMPVETRIKELEYETNAKTTKTMRDYDEIVREIDLIIAQCRKELVIYSSSSFLDSLVKKIKIIEYLPVLLNKGIGIKILVDSRDLHLIRQIENIKTVDKANSIQLEHSSKMESLDEFLIISDGKYLIKIKYDNYNRLVAAFSNEEHSVLVQELMFEKHWNEVKSLSVLNTN